MESGYWESIPNEILENILIAVPTYQLPFKESWVCKRWTRIILQPQFWVHKLKNHGLSIDDQIWSLLQEYENDEIVSCLYYASLYQEHCTLQTPCTPYAYLCQEYNGGSKNTSNLTDEEVDRELWIITENFDTILMASGILVCRSQWFAYLALKKGQKIKSLPLLLRLIEVRKVALSVRDDYAFWNFSPRINYLQFLKGSSNEGKQLKDFRGCLPTLEGLPFSVKEMFLSIGVDDQNVAIDPGLSRINRDTKIKLHLKAGTEISNLTKVSSDHSITFIVSNLEESHLNWMAEVTKKFLTNGELMLIFFNFQLDLKSSENLLNSMSEAGFDLEFEILCSSPTLSDDSETLLDELAFLLWPNCAGGFQLFHCDDSLTYHLWNEYGAFYTIEHGDHIDYENGIWLEPYKN